MFRQTTYFKENRNSIQNSHLAVCQDVWLERRAWHLDDCSPSVGQATLQGGEAGKGQGEGREGLLAQCSAHHCSSLLSVYEPARWQSLCGQRPAQPTPADSVMLIKFTLQQAFIPCYNLKMMKQTHTDTKNLSIKAAQTSVMNVNNGERLGD